MQQHHLVPLHSCSVNHTILGQAAKVEQRIGLVSWIQKTKPIKCNELHLYYFGDEAFPPSVA